MMMTILNTGFRVVGHRGAKRRAIAHAATFAGYASCDSRVEVEKEAYLSYFVFGPEFSAYLKNNGSEASYNGVCGAHWIWWDVDRPDDLGAALRDGRRLAGAILDRYRTLNDDDLLVFVSGSKGVHVGIPAVWQPEPSTDFHAVTKAFCLGLAEMAGVVADGSIYSKTRLFRAPNSRHPKTGLFKRRISLDELMHLKPEAIAILARTPESFDIPTGPSVCTPAADDWSNARRKVESASERRAPYREGPAKLTAFARRFLMDGEHEPGQREVSTFRVAAELSEMYLNSGFPAVLLALLQEQALDLGLTPSEARHAIEGGWKHAERQKGAKS